MFRRIPKPSFLTVSVHVVKKVKVKVKCTIVQALSHCTGRTVHRGSRGITLLFLDHGTRRDEWSASRPGRSLPLGKTRYPLYRRMGGPQGRSGHLGKIRPPSALDPLTVQPIAQSLYRLVQVERSIFTGVRKDHSALIVMTECLRRVANIITDTWRAPAVHRGGNNSPTNTA